MTDSNTPPASSSAPSPERIELARAEFERWTTGSGSFRTANQRYQVLRLEGYVYEEISAHSSLLEAEQVRSRSAWEAALSAALASPPSTAEGPLFSDDELPECVAESEKFGGLGPNYFVGRKIAKRFMTQFQDEHFKPLVDTFVEQFRDRMWDSVRDHLLSDTESNIQGEIWSGIDRVVEALLTGKEWALRQYVTEKKYGDGETIRAAVAKLIPAELQDARLADLQAENDKLSQENKRLRERY